MTYTERISAVYPSFGRLHHPLHHLRHEDAFPRLEEPQPQEHGTTPAPSQKIDCLLHTVLYSLSHLDLGLFLYLTLIYFFSNDEWMIILRNLILIPQIIHNVRLGNNPGFNLYYIFGFIGSRLLIPMYERLCPENRFSLTPNITLVVILLALYAL